MEYLTLILTFIGGLFCGGIAMAMVAAGAYERGVKDERDRIELPADVERYLNDLNLNEEL